MIAEGLAMIGIIYLAFFMGLGIIAIIISGLRILLELIKEKIIIGGLNERS
ncbi:MAG: hypothetical protein J6T10_26595 [Methanobrevibacter sp.]|nr:hypothetical protein [Methanobrevibacter sp.]